MFPRYLKSYLWLHGYMFWCRNFVFSKNVMFSIFGKNVMFSGLKIQKSWLASLEWPLNAKYWRQLLRIWKNFNIFEKNFRESEIIQKVKLKNILFQRYGQSINEQYIDQPQNLNKNNITPQPVRFTSSN